MIFKSQSAHIKFEEYPKCLHGEDYRKECDNYNFCSPNQEMYLQKVQKSTYLYSMINDVTKIKVEVNHGTNSIRWLKSQRKV